MTAPRRVSSSAESGRSRRRSRRRTRSPRSAAAAVLHIGIAGAQTLPHGSLVIGSESVYCDLVDARRASRASSGWSPRRTCSPRRAAALPDAHVLPIATSGQVGGGAACEVEAMEGFGVLRAAALAGVPALELRAISNPVAERDRAAGGSTTRSTRSRAALPPLLEELADA